MRLLVCDYGRKFFYRHEIFLPAVIFAATLSLVLLVDITVLHLVNTGTNREDKKLEAFCLFNFVLLFFLALSLLNTAGLINAEFGYHNHILKINVSFLKDLKGYTDFYFKKKGLKSHNSESSLFKRMPTSYLHKKFTDEILFKIGDSDDFKRDVDKLLGELEDVNEVIIDNLVDEEEYNSFKIFGIKIVRNSIAQFLIAFVSVAVTMYEVLGENSTIGY